MNWDGKFQEKNWVKIAQNWVKFRQNWVKIKLKCLGQISICEHNWAFLNQNKQTKKDADSNFNRFKFVHA